MKEKEDEIEEEKEAEENLKTKIREMRKNRNRERKTARGMPARKKTKLDNQAIRAPQRPETANQKRENQMKTRSTKKRQIHQKKDQGSNWTSGHSPKTLVKRQVSSTKVPQK